MLKKNLVLIIGIVLLLIAKNLAGQITNDYRSLNTGNWSTIANWERFNGSVWVVATEYPGQTALNAETVTIRNGHTMSIDNSAATCTHLIVQTGSTLQFNNSNRNLAVNGDVTVENGATLQSFLSCTGDRTYTLTVAGSMQIDGNLNGYHDNAGNEGMLTISFTGATNETISGTGTFEVYEITLNKGTDWTSILDISMPITIVDANGTNTQNINITNGTFKLSSASSIIAYNGNRTICNASGRLWLNHADAYIGWNAIGNATVYGELIIDNGALNCPGTMTIEGNVLANNMVNNGTLNIGQNLDLESNFTINGGVTSITALLYIDGNDIGDAGNLTINAGTFNVGDGNDYLQLIGNTGNESTGGDLTIHGGTVNIYGRLDIQDGSGTEICSFTMTGGTINIDPQVDATYIANNSHIIFIPNNAEINFTGGSIVVTDPHADKTSLAYYALYIAGTTGIKNFTGSTISFGDGISSSSGDDLYPGYSILAASGVALDNVIFNNPTGYRRSGIIQAAAPNYLTINNLTISTPNDTFSVNGRTLDIKENFANNGVLDASVANSILKFSGSAEQNFTGTGTILGNLANFTVDNSSATGLNSDFDVSATTVNLLNGNYYNDGFTLNVTGTLPSNLLFGAGSFTSGALQISLPANASAAQYNFPVGKSTNQLLEIFDISTSGSGTATLKTEFIEAPTSGIGGNGVRNPLNADNGYWKIDFALNSVNLDHLTNIRAEKTVLTPPAKVLAQCNNTHIGGTYTSIGGTISGTQITSDNFDLNGLSPSGTAYLIVAEVDPLIGTYTVGATGDFLNLTEVAQVMREKVVDDYVFFELLADYDDNTETLPIVFDVLTTTNPAYNITIRPASGVSGTSTAQNGAVDNQSLIIIDGISGLIFDGRPGSIGVSDWQMANTRPTNPGPVFEFKNGAKNNQLNYLRIQSDNNHATSGIIVFGGTTGLSGNSENIIQQCKMSGYSDFPRHAIYSAGETGINNENNQILNNHFENIFRSDADTKIIFIDANSSTWNISSNTFYQTAPRIFSGSFVYYAIDILSGYDYTIDANIIGYADENQTSTGFTDISGSTGRIIGMHLNTSNGVYSDLTNNIFSNIIFSTANTNQTNGIFNAIYIQGGDVNVGTSGNGNIIGNTGAFVTYPIQINYGANDGQVIGIYSSSLRSIKFVDNQIGGFSLQGNYNTWFIGIQAVANSAAANYEYVGNIIGSSGQTNSILIGNAADNTIKRFYGIWNYDSGNNTLIQNNTIANASILTISNDGRNVARGILVERTTGILSNNQVFNLKSSSGQLNNHRDASIVGISVNSTSTAPHQIIGNTVYGLENNNIAGNRSIKITGIYVDNTDAAKPTNIVQANFVHSFKINTSNETSEMHGIYIDNGNYLVYNNMIRLGIDADAADITSSHVMYGIHFYQNGIADFYHNSVYIGGNNVTGAANTYSFYKKESTISQINNNIFVNARSNGAGTGKHAAYYLAFDEAINTDYNIYFAPGTGGLLAIYDNIFEFTNIRGMQNYTNYKDMHSGAGNPNFVAPAANASTVSLHLNSPNPAEGMGIDIASVTSDFDNETRTSLSPFDIGADAGNYTNDASSDIYMPIFTYTAINPQNCGITNLDISVQITDRGVGLNTSAGSAPFIWYRDRSTPGAWQSAEATLLNGNEFDGIWQFSLTGLNDNLFFEYYFVAQDIATTSNMSYSKFNDNTPLHSSTAIQNTAPDAGVNVDVFSVCVNPKAEYYVGNNTDCPSCDFETLTAYGDFFFNINSMIIDKSITCYIVANTTEPAVYGAEELTESGAGSYTITIKPNDASEKTILANNLVNKSLIRLEGAQRYIIDGQFSNDGNRWLKFVHEKNDQSVIQFKNDAQNNIIRYSQLIASPELNPLGIVFFDAASVVGNNNNTIEYNIIKNNINYPLNLVFSYGDNNFPNAQNTISNNIMGNFQQFGIWLTTSGNGDAWNISNNTIYNEYVSSLEHGAIKIDKGSGHTISGNQIGGNAANNSGIWNYNGTYEYNTIYIDGGNSAQSNISGNTLQNIQTSNTSATATIRAIRAINSTAANINNNTITNFAVEGNRNNYVISYVTTEPASISGNTISNYSYSGNADFYGIYLSNDASDVNILDNNTLNAINMSNTGGNSDFFGIYLAAGQAGIHGNILGGANPGDKITVTGGSFEGISLRGGASQQDISNNAISNIEIQGNEIFRAFYLADLAENISFNVSNNQIDQISLTNTGASTEFFGFDLADGLFQFTGNICGTEPLGINNAGSGRTYGIYAYTGFDANSIIENNQISNLNGNGSIIGIYSNRGVVHSISQNQISGFNLSAEIVFAGIRSNAGTVSMQGNTIDDITLTNTGAGTEFRAIWLSGARINAGDLNPNIIGTAAKPISNSGSGETNGFFVTGGTNSLISGNTIAYISGNGNTNAFSISGGTTSYTNNIVENIDITADATFCGFLVSNGTNSIQGNEIRGIQLGNPGSASYFYGMNITGGTANIGDINGNTIGHAINANSVSCNGIGTIGIYLGSSADCNASNNLIANISSINTSNTAQLKGMLISGTGNHIVSANTIRDLRSDNSNTNSTLGTLSAEGIFAENSGNFNINSNLIFNLSATGNAATQISAISETAENVSFTSNRIYNITNTSSTAGKTVNGISLSALDNGLVANNMISLGANDDAEYRGIFIASENAFTKRIVHNSVQLEGTASGGNSYAFSRKALQTPIELKNNILSNLRNGSGSHYAIEINDVSNININNLNANAYYTANSVTLGRWNNSDVNFDNWTNNTGENIEYRSTNQPITFTDASVADLHIDASNACALNNTGIVIADVSTDVDAELRNTNAPDLGADEFSPAVHSGEYVWRGFISDDWDNAANWQCEEVPANNPGEDIVITGNSNHAIIQRILPAATIYSDNIRVLVDGVLQINPGNSLTISGNLYNNGELISVSPNSTGAAGSIITEGNNSGTGQVRLQRYFSVGGRWQYTSVPFSNVSSTFFTGNAASFNPNLFKYNEAFDLDPNPSGAIYNEWTNLSDAWELAHNGEASPVSLTKGKGYIYYDETDKLLTFSNSTTDLSNTDYIFPINFTANDANSDYFDGWNLVSNPYPSAIDWLQVNTTNIQNTVYYWDGIKYVYYNGVSGNQADEGSNIVNGGSQYIPALQGFFVKATASGNFTIPLAARTHNSQSLWKTSKSSYSDFDMKYLKLKTENEQGTDELSIRFFEAATQNFDADFDAYKMYSPSIPNIFSLAGNIPMAIQSLPEFDINMIIPVQLKAAAIGEYSITLNSSNMPDTVTIYLKDIKSGKTAALRNEYLSVNFASAGETKDFQLYFKNSNSPEEPLEALRIYVAGKTINLQNLSSELNYSLSIYNILGQKMLSQSLSEENPSVETNLKTGVYFILIENGVFQMTEKIVIE